ncbi:hypothetical protein AYX13_06539 [Cryptococcus neoformans]|nr:hypothetical protein AYX13_06539 [Cryptococcus neoformans var. grubii]
MNFSPYQPPPDVPSTDPPEVPAKSKPKTKRPWFTRDPSSYNANSYQSGGSIADPSALPHAYPHAYTDPDAHPENDRANAWESRFGWRVDAMAAATYLGGPLTALFFLILETRNDYVRFHAYQSALLTTPLLVLLLLFNLLIPLPAFLRALLVIAAVGGTLYAAFRAWKDAQEGLERYWLPYIGPIAERWVSEE